MLSLQKGELYRVIPKNWEIFGVIFKDYKGMDHFVINQ